MSSPIAQPVMERSQVRIVPLSELTVPKVDQRGPEGFGEFTYVDISSIDNRLKKIVDPKHLPVTVAPGRARQRLKTGDVIVSMTRPNLNAVALVPPELDGAIASTGFDVLRATDGINCRWIYYAVQTSEFVRDMSQLVQGALYPAVRPKDIRRYQIPVPDEKQQCEIVAEIEKQFSRLDEAVANLNRVKANLKRYKAAVLKAAVEGKLTEEWRKTYPDVEPASELLRQIVAERRAKWKGRGKYKEPALLDSANLPSLPDSWAWTTLDSLLREPLRNGHSAKATGTGMGLRAFTLSAVTEGDFSERNTKLTVADASNVTDLWAEPGDIFVERSNTPELVGIARLYRGPKGFAFIPDLLIRVRLLSQVSPRFVELCLLSERGRNYFRSRAQGISGSMPKIDQAVVETAPIPIAPLLEQESIVSEVDRRFSIIERFEGAVNGNVNRADRLRDVVLKSAFAGRIVG
jgi:type I restriction enzyme S subunit